jgi:hypothetical protein
MKSKRMKWVRHTLHMGEMRNIYKILGGNLKEKYYFNDQGVGRKIMLRLVLKK